MALSTAELARIKAELGFSLLSRQNPYVNSYALLFEQVIAPYLEAGDATTSTTVVASASVPTPVVLTLAAATGVTAGCRVIIDVDERQESATVRNLSGATINVSLSLAHGPDSYPVIVEGGESLVREALTRIRETKTKMATAYGSGALKKVDEIEFYEANGKTYFGVLGDQLMAWREELAAILGIESMWAQKRSGGSRMAVY